MKIGISELHFLIRQIEARLEWIDNTPNCESIQEGEEEKLKCLLGKLIDIKFELKIDESP